MKAVHPNWRWKACLYLAHGQTPCRSGLSEVVLTFGKLPSTLDAPAQAQTANQLILAHFASPMKALALFLM